MLGAFLGDTGEIRLEVEHTVVVLVEGEGLMTCTYEFA